LRSSELVVPERVVERLLTKVAMGPKTIDVDTPCHLSTYSTASHEYAQVGWNERGERIVTLCHIAIWVADHGPVPVGLTVDHKCHVRRCIRLDHLRLLSNADNGRRNRPGLDWVLDGSCARGHGPEFRVPVKEKTGHRKTRCEVCTREDKAKSAAKPETKAYKAEWARRKRQASNVT
jgi:hypothetical protein